MESNEKISRFVISNIQEAVHFASHDYFIFSRGSILYDHGVEMMMAVYSAKKLFEFFSSSIVVKLESSVKNLLSSRTGRFDMTVDFYSGETFAVEFKRFSNPASIKNDLNRLKEVTQHGVIGLFVAPCYMKSGAGENWDWPLRERNSQNIVPLHSWHLSEPEELPDIGSRHPQGWTHERVLVIEVTP